MPIYGYGPKCAVLDLKQNPTIYIIDDAKITHGFRKEFDILWSMAKPNKNT